MKLSLVHCPVLKAIAQAPVPPRDLFSSPHENPRHYLTLDNVVYHRTDSSEVPQGFAEVDVKLDDNGLKMDTVLTAGLVGSRVCDSGDDTLGADGKRDTMKPVIAWWMFVSKGVSE